ncbi:MAG TPA: hypothetical protein VLS89_19290 [Candidatus Nanopelagicales bacterium]|nr:hypothetical protein [Candidatus Nanopelagicales bacterium]
MTDRAEYKVTVDGVDAFDLQVSLLRDLCDVLIEGAQRSARLAVEGRSQARGATPAWLISAADLRIAKYAAGSLDLAVSAPSLHRAAPGMSAALHGASVREGLTALDLFLDAVEDAVVGRQDSDRLDAGVLDVLARTGALFARGPMTLSLGRRGGKPVTIDPGAAQGIQAMAARTPGASVSRVRGALDALTMSTRTFVLKIEGGKVLRGLTGDVPLETLKGLLGVEIVVEGLVTFKPSGDPLQIEADHAAAARPEDSLWARLPHIDVGARRVAPTAAAPELGKLLVEWPGDESDDEIFQKLEAMAMSRRPCC